MKLSDYQYGFDGMTRERMHEKMAKGWQSSETPCGRGSELGHTGAIRRWLPVLVEEYEIELIADCGAGDLNWIKHVPWSQPYPHCDHFDLVPRTPDVQKFDVTLDVLKQEYHLVICRHVLNHLSPKLALDALDKFVESGSGWLLITNCQNQIEYWEACGMRLIEPLQTWNDATKWWCELHYLQMDGGIMERP